MSEQKPRPHTRPPFQRAQAHDTTEICDLGGKRGNTLTFRRKRRRRWKKKKRQ